MVYPHSKALNLSFKIIKQTKKYTKQEELTSSKMEKDFVQMGIKVKWINIECFSLAREHSKDYLNCIKTLTVIKLVVRNKVIKHFN